MAAAIIIGTSDVANAGLFLSAVNLRRCFYPILLLALLSGCATQPLPSVQQFLKLDTDPRVRYEAGADAYARLVAGLLPLAIQQVEIVHARPFSSAVEVFVCASVDCFAGYVRTPNLSAATVRDNRVFLGPQLFGREAHRLQSTEAHTNTSTELEKGRA